VISDGSLAAMKVDRSELGNLDLIASGGQAHVYRVPQVHFDIADFPLACKMYKTRNLPIPWIGLARLAHVREAADPKVRSLLDRYFTWPLRAVMDGNEAVGCVMPLIPDNFFHTFTLPNATTKRTPLELQHLLVAGDRNAKVGLMHANANQRLSICFETSRALNVLHSTGLVYGDINPRNLVFRLKPRPSIMFVEGDALRRSGASAVLAQMQTPDWNAPDKVKAQSEYTDRYKLGLLILRVLTPGAGSSTNRDPSAADSVLNREGRKLLRRALDVDRDHRPAPDEWIKYFKTVLLGSSAQQTGSPSSGMPRPQAPSGSSDDLGIPSPGAHHVKGASWVKRNGLWERQP
jgi:hypothetical protein